jgi:hypothetical protein
MANITYWLVLTACCIWLESFLPGVHVFAPAVIVCLQTRRLQSLVWLLLLWVVIQEGVGSLAFGGTVFFYFGLILFFFLAQSFFAVHSPVFILGLSAFCGLMHLFELLLMTSLQELTVPMNQIVTESLLNSALFPVIWGLIMLTWQRWVPEHHGP